MLLPLTPWNVNDQTISQPHGRDYRPNASMIVVKQNFFSAQVMNFMAAVPIYYTCLENLDLPDASVCNWTTMLCMLANMMFYDT